MKLILEQDERLLLLDTFENLMDDWITSERAVIGEFSGDFLADLKKLDEAATARLRVYSFGLDLLRLPKKLQELRTDILQQDILVDEFGS